MEHHQGTPIENNKINLPNEDVLVCGEYQINSTGAEVIEVKSTNGIQNQELLDNKDVSLPAKLTFCLMFWNLSFSFSRLLVDGSD